MPGDGNVPGATRWWTSSAVATRRKFLGNRSRCCDTCKMSWLNWSADIKKRACRYLLQRYLGQFLEELTLDQLTVDLYNGTGRVVNVSLDVQVYNATCFSLSLARVPSFLPQNLGEDKIALHTHSVNCAQHACCTCVRRKVKKEWASFFILGFALERERITCISIL